MTHSSVRGHTPEYHHGDNVVDLPQEAALVRELRRLQKFLEQEQERERFPHAVDFQSVKRLCSHARDDKISTSAKPVNGPVDRLLDRLGLNRHDPENTPSSTRQATGICKASGAPRWENAVAPRVAPRVRTNGCTDSSSAG